MKKQLNNQGPGTWDLGPGKNGIPEYRRTGGPDTEKSAIRNTTLRSNSLRSTSPQSAIKQTGFTLMEIMMSLGILVVGLAMVATAFPTAMLETRHSVADTSATMISENAASICRVRLSHNTIKGPVGGTLSEQTTLIDDAHTGDLTYPVTYGDHDSNPDGWFENPPSSGTWLPSTRYGWLLAARQIDDTNDTNDYQLVIVPYRKFLPVDSAPTFLDVTVNGDGDKAARDDAHVSGIDVGSPVIVKSTGEYAFVLDSDGTLSRVLPGGAGAIVVDVDFGDNRNDSPAIGCYVVRTSVAP